MNFRLDQLIIVLSPFTEVEVYGNIKFQSARSLTLAVKTAGLLKEGWDILCVVVDDGDIYEFYSRVEFIEGSNVMIEKPVQSGVVSVEKRRFNRVDCDIGFVARLMRINNVSVQKYGKTFVGTIKNISAGGILAETNLCLPVDLVFSFKLKINYFIDCTARITRVSEVPNEKKYLIGCEFIDMSLEDIKSISMFVFKEQLKKKRQELYEDVFR